MWFAVRNRRLGGFKFRRQASVGPYVVDFLCIEAKIVLEIDGGQHRPEIDAERTAWIESQGFRMSRF